LDNNTCVLIKENVPSFAPFFERIRQIAKFRIEVFGIDQLLAGDRGQDIKQALLPGSFVVIEQRIFDEHREKILAVMRTICGRPFSNFVVLSITGSFLDDPAFLEGSRPCFFMPESGDVDMLAVQFVSFLVTLFEKSVISNRLTDYIRDSFREVVYSEILIKKNKEIERLNKELERRNKIDYLTSLYNRNALFDFLDCEWKRTNRDLWRLTNSQVMKKDRRKLGANNGVHKHNPVGTLLDHFGVFSIMMIDIDHFKTVNDTYGHLAGDKVLRAAGKMFLTDNILRKSDIACRFGGEEFIVLLPETSAAHAFGPALRLSESFSNITFFDDGRNFNVTLSIGVSELHSEDKTNEDIIQRADKALYHAKKIGRGKVIVYEQTFEQESV
jgi:diguanylate cyclase (GGDEF)-like protein